MGPKNVPFLTTHDGRTIRYPDPLIKVNDTIRLDIATSTIIDFIKFDSGSLFRYETLWCIRILLFMEIIFSGNLCMITGGRNLGRVGTIVSRERHPGSFDIVHVKDSQDHTFATRFVWWRNRYFHFVGESYVIIC